MLVNDIKGNGMGEGNKYGRMGRFMRGIEKIIWPMELVG